MPRLIVNAFCNECLSLPNFDLFIISLSVKTILVVAYWFTTDPYVVAFSTVNIINSVLVAMETAPFATTPLWQNIGLKGYLDQNMLFLSQL